MSLISYLRWHGVMMSTVSYDVLSHHTLIADVTCGVVTLMVDIITHVHYGLENLLTLNPQELKPHILSFMKRPSCSPFLSWKEQELVSDFSDSWMMLQVNKTKVDISTLRIISHILNKYYKWNIVELIFVNNVYSIQKVGKNEKDWNISHKSNWQNLH